jgi:hypothetical protein
MRVSLAGGEPARLAATSPVSRGGVWGDDGYIYFAPSESAGILRIAADGGVPEPVTQAVVTAGVQTQVWPDLSPGADVLLYVVPGDSEDEARIVARSLRTGRERTIVEGGTSPRAAPGGLVTFARGDTIFAVDFDAGALEARGIPRPLLSGVQMSPLFGSSYYAVSREGTLVYAPGDARPLRRALLWVTPSGEESPGFVEERPFLFPAISPDGNSVAITIEGAHQDLWRFEVGQPVLKRLTTAPSQDFGPVWSRDGTRLAFTSVKHGQVPAAFVKPADRSDEESHLAAASFPNVWSLAGDAVIVTTERGEANRRAVPQLLAVPLDRSEPPRPVLASRFSRYGAAMSPDGRRLAYVSLETGRAEVFVATDGSNVQVSIGGGTSPIWSRDGRQLFYRNGDAVLSVAVGSTTGLWPEPRVLFRGRFEEPGRHDWPRNYDVAPDGRFLMIRQTYAPAPRELVVVLDWRGQALRAPD